MAAECPTKCLSVVVAAPEAGSSLRKCLASLAAQVLPTGGEIIVCDGSRAGAERQLKRDFASVGFLQFAPGTSVPRLWSAGIARSRGKVVALTIEQCVPERNWAEHVLRAHAAEWPAIGGAMEIDQTVGLVDWAVYFCRYSRYIPPFATRVLEDLPGDNCSYKHDALAGLHEEMREGFWETFIHQALRARGGQLLSDPSIVVRYGGAFSCADFLRHRFGHGRYFAARRARAMSRIERLLRAAAFPVVPLMLLRGIAPRVWRSRRYRAKFVAALPLVTSFLIAWASGECVGYLFGPPEGLASAPQESTVWDHSG